MTAKRIRHSTGRAMANSTIVWPFSLRIEVRRRLIRVKTFVRDLRRWAPEGAHRPGGSADKAQDPVDRACDATRQCGEHRDRGDADDGENDPVLRHRLTVLAVAVRAQKLKRFREGRRCCSSL